MKRVFPLIVVLITLSVLGMLFTQFNWIQNAISVKRAQYQEDLESAGKIIRENLSGAFLLKGNFGYIPNEQNKRFILDSRFSASYFSEDEVSKIISDALKTRGIRQPFEFAVTNIFNYEIKGSDGYKTAMIAESKHIPLTSENASAQETLHLFVTEPKNYIISQMGWMIVASIILTTIIISAFALTVRTLFAQKKLSEIKSDFINNMTHELKTPLATISLATAALNNDKVVCDPTQIRYYSGMIKEENNRMNQQVETILQAARIERDEVELNTRPLDAHEVIHRIADNVTLLVQQKNGVMHLNLNAQRHLVEADPVHFTNIINNLFDNAIKYASETDLRINVTTQNTGGKLVIKVRDNGIGMDRETQSRVFEKFYRATTGNIHNVKGFGLGLSYVQAMVQAHKGSIKVESAPGKGSTFTVTFPALSV